MISQAESTWTPARMAKTLGMSFAVIAVFEVINLIAQILLRDSGDVAQVVVAILTQLLSFLARVIEHQFGYSVCGGVTDEIGGHARSPLLQTTWCLAFGQAPTERFQRDGGGVKGCIGLALGVAASRARLPYRSCPPKPAFG